MKTFSNYRIVERDMSKGLLSFEEKIRGRLELGWQLHGSLQVIYDQHKNIRMFQPMVKYSYDTEDKGPM